MASARIPTALQEPGCHCANGLFGRLSSLGHQPPERGPRRGGRPAPEGPVRDRRPGRGGGARGADGTSPPFPRANAWRRQPHKNAAGSTCLADIVQTLRRVDLDEWRQLVEVDLFGPLQVTKSHRPLRAGASRRLCHIQELSYSRTVVLVSCRRGQFCGRPPARIQKREYTVSKGG